MMKNGYDQEYVVQLGMNLDGLTYFGLTKRSEIFSPVGSPPVSLSVLTQYRMDFVSSLDAAIAFLEAHLVIPEGINDPGIIPILNNIRTYISEVEDIAVHVLPKRKSW